ncbi:unnamed protein product [Prorocentrum cordatum]|uniref:Calmodulin n=1 Tax=Prorocentrum cordatum TaxID=2364126 RepID=A0ABN9XJC0_9DINO|nr:unnamed protein product [Polarella glacialis]
MGSSAARPPGPQPRRRLDGRRERPQAVQAQQAAQCPAWEAPSAARAAATPLREPPPAARPPATPAAAQRQAEQHRQPAPRAPAAHAVATQPAPAPPAPPPARQVLERPQPRVGAPRGSAAARAAAAGEKAVELWTDIDRRRVEQAEPPPAGERGWAPDAVSRAAGQQLADGHGAPPSGASGEIALAWGADGGWEGPAPAPEAAWAGGGGGPGPPPEERRRDHRRQHRKHRKHARGEAHEEVAPPWCAEGAPAEGAAAFGGDAGGFEGAPGPGDGGGAPGGAAGLGGDAAASGAPERLAASGALPPWRAALEAQEAEWPLAPGTRFQQAHSVGTLDWAFVSHAQLARALPEARRPRWPCVPKDVDVSWARRSPRAVGTEVAAPRGSSGRPDPLAWATAAGFRTGAWGKQRAGAPPPLPQIRGREEATAARNNQVLKQLVEYVQLLKEQVHGEAGGGGPRPAAAGAAAAAEQRGAGASVASWAPSAEELERYAAVFAGAAQGGAVVGPDRGREVFEQSQLPTPELAQIWRMADVDNDGALGRGEFLCAMTMVGKRLGGAELPVELPPELAELARDGGPLGVAAPGAPLALPASATPLAPKPSSWQVADAELERYRAQFSSLDDASAGWLPPEAVVPVLQQTGVPDDDLSYLWDLLNQADPGRVTPGEFVCIMVLVDRVRGGEPHPMRLPGELAALLGHPAGTPQSVRAPSRGPSRDALQGHSPHFGTAAAGAEGDAGLAPAAGVVAMADEAQAPVEARPADPSPAAGSVTGQLPMRPSREEVESYVALFRSRDVSGSGFMDPGQARELLERSGLPVPELQRIWHMADADGDGRLSEPEFVYAVVLARRRQQGAPLPPALPPELAAAVAGAAPSP